MNARELQQAVMKDLESLFSGDRYKTPLRTMEPIKTYAQQLPKFDAQEIDDFFPYAIVRIDKGGVENQTSPHKVDIHRGKRKPGARRAAVLHWRRWLGQQELRKHCSP